MHAQQAAAEVLLSVLFINSLSPRLTATAKLSNRHCQVRTRYEQEECSDRPAYGGFLAAVSAELAPKAVGETELEVSGLHSASRFTLQLSVPIPDPRWSQT